MVDPLYVDTARLDEAAKALQGNVFPEVPAPLHVPGGDVVAIAVNETMALIETPVIEGMPITAAALARTAAAMAVAAAAYVETDRRHGGRLESELVQSNPHQPSTATFSTNRSTDGDSLTVASAFGAADELAAPTGRVGDVLGRAVESSEHWGELSQSVTSLGTLAQTISTTVQGAVGSRSSVPAPPGRDQPNDEDGDEEAHSDDAEKLAAGPESALVGQRAPVDVQPVAPQYGRAAAAHAPE